VNVLIADKFEQSGIDGLKDLGCNVVSEPAAGAEGLGSAIAKHKPDALIVRSTKVLPAALDAASGLKLIVRAGAGVDNIDIPSASRKRIAVCNCPGMNAVAVAELAFGLLIATDRRIVDQTYELRAGKWNKKEFGKSKGLKGRTLGIVGVGAIGSAVAKRALAFEMNVIGWDKFLDAGTAQRLGIRFAGQTRADLLKMVPECDAITVHVASVPETRQLCNREFFGAMKKGAYFINTSRGAVVDEGALREAVQTKGIRAALDVYEGQPATPEAAWQCETVKIAGVIGTHHCGASTDQAQQAVADETVRIVQVFKETGRAENCVNAGDIR